MIRSIAAERTESKNHEFRYRGKEPGRLENFADASLSLAVTILLISSSPPTNYEMIRKFVWELVPFSLCIFFIVFVWYEHFLFFYRYGLRSTKVILLNTIFIIIVLFYVYPLKFLTRLLLIPISFVVDAPDVRKEVLQTMVGTDIGELMIIYGVGAAAISLVMMLLYRTALSEAKTLELNAIEIFDTKVSIRSQLLLAAVPMLSVVMAIIFRGHSFLAGMIPGFTYFLYTPIMWINGAKAQKQRQKLIESLSTTNEDHFSSSSSKAGAPI